MKQKIFDGVHYIEVFTSHSSLFAITIQTDLQKAGIPTRLVEDIENESSVMVPEDCVDEAKALINTIPKHGEIFSSPPPQAE
ncbi:MAG: hypothetical protein JW750_07995 [Anaerolineaceae bacterium]|nr:hypothetical protein [Anaerolineaceae bacterium]